MKIRPWNENIWFSPRYVIDELSRAAIERKNLKRYKEAWICAVAFICHSSLSNIEWWLQVPKADPPDVLVMELASHKDGDGQDLSLVKVEVFEISSFDDESIEESIERKLDKKDYTGMTLVAFVRRQIPFDHKAVADYLSKVCPKIQNLFLIAREENNTNVSFLSLYPKFLKFKADFGLWCKDTDQRDFIDVRRGIGAIRDHYATDDRLTFIP